MKQRVLVINGSEVLTINTEAIDLTVKTEEEENGISISEYLESTLKSNMYYDGIWSKCEWYWEDKEVLLNLLFQGDKIQIKNAYALYDLYNGYVIDNDLCNSLTKKEKETIEYIRDNYKMIYDMFPKKTIHLDEFEEWIFNNFIEKERE
jgi:hypothetical protein